MQFGDWCTWFFCSTCALCQETRTVERMQEAEAAGPLLAYAVHADMAPAQQVVEHV